MGRGVCVCVCVCVYGLQPTTLLCPWDFLGKKTGVGCHFLVQEIFPTQGLNLRLLCWQADSLSLSHLGSPHVGRWGKLTEEKKKEREASFCAGSPKLHASSWDACAEMVALSPEGGGCWPCEVTEGTFVQAQVEGCWTSPNQFKLEVDSIYSKFLKNSQANIFLFMQHDILE